MLIRATAALLFAFAAIGGARAQDASGCDKFKWSVARERAWFAASPKPIDAGADLTAADNAYLVTLVAGDAAGFVKPPERAPKPGSFGAVLTMALGTAGSYQITISDEAWIDIIQGGARLKSSAFSGQKNCPGVRKTVRFDLAAGPATMQISNAEGPRIMLAVAPAE